MKKSSRFVNGVLNINSLNSSNKHIKKEFKNNNDSMISSISELAKDKKIGGSRLESHNKSDTNDNKNKLRDDKDLKRSMDKLNFNTSSSTKDDKYKLSTDHSDRRYNLKFINSNNKDINQENINIDDIVDDI